MIKATTVKVAGQWVNYRILLVSLLLFKAA